MKKAVRYHAGILLLLAIVITLAFHSPAEAASWKKKGNTVTNGSTTYKFKSGKFVRTNKKGRVTKTIYTPGEMETSPKILYFYKNNIVVEYFYMYDGMFGKYEGKTLLYNVRTGRLKKLGTFHVIGRSGSYLLGTGIISSFYYEAADADNDDDGYQPDGDDDDQYDFEDADSEGVSESQLIDEALENAVGPVYSVNIITGRKVKLTDSGMHAAVKGSWFYYVQRSEEYQKIVRCKPAGTGKKVLRKLLWDYKWDIQKLTNKKLTVTLLRTNTIQNFSF